MHPLVQIGFQLSQHAQCFLVTSLRSHERRRGTVVVCLVGDVHNQYKAVTYTSIMTQALLHPSLSDTLTCSPTHLFALWITRIHTHESAAHVTHRQWSSSGSPCTATHAHAHVFVSLTKSGESTHTNTTTHVPSKYLHMTIMVN